MPSISGYISLKEVKRIVRNAPDPSKTRDSGAESEKEPGFDGSIRLAAVE